MHRTLVAILLSSTAVAGDVQPFQAQDIAPVQAESVKPSRAQDIAPVHATPVQPASGAAAPSPQRSADIEPFHAQSATRVQFGVDPVTERRPVERAVIGTWLLQIPNASWTTRTQEGPNVVDTTRSGVGAAMGALKIDAQGNFTWLRGSKPVARGKVQEVRPRQGADANARYYRVKNEREEFYVSAANGTLTVVTVAGNAHVANGHRR